MADPSTLLLIACVGCPPVPEPSVQPPLPVCHSSQEQNQDGSSGGEARPCPSVPERIPSERVTSNRVTTSNRITSEVSFIARSSAPETRQLSGQPSAPDVVPSVNWSNQVGGLTQAPLLKLGSQGQAVSALQTRLRQLGYNPGAIDAVYGAVTQAAVIAFQRDRGLIPDGVVGAKTWSALQKNNPQSQSEPQVREAAPNRDVTRPQPNSSPSNSSAPDLSDTSDPRDLDSPDPDSPDPDVPASEQSDILNRSSDSLDPVAEDTLPTAKPEQPDSLPIEYLWIVGWAVIYLGGWGFLVKDLVKELAGLSGVKPITRRKDFDEAIQKRAKRRDTTTIGVTIVSPTHATVSPTHATISPTHATNGVTQKAQPHHADPSLNHKTPTEHSSTEKNTNGKVNSPSIVLRSQDTKPQDINSELPPSQHSVESYEQDGLDEQLLDVTLANQGKVRPLRNVFIELRRVSSSNHANPTTDLPSVTANIPETNTETIPKTVTPSTQIPEPSSEPSSEPNPELDRELIENSDVHETLIAILPTHAENGEPCTYTLINDAEGLFVLRGNQLRVVNRYLNENETNLSRVITLRRSDVKGFVEKSFKLDIEGIRKLNTSTPELTRG